MIVPGSHRYGHRPPPEVQDEHPAGAEHIEAPAGSVCIFDSKTWHRSHWNRSTDDRMAILNNVLPRWVTPMSTHDHVMSKFKESGKEEAWLTPRERFDANSIMRTQWGFSHGLQDYKRAQRDAERRGGSAGQEHGVISQQYTPDEGSKRAAAAARL